MGFETDPLKVYCPARPAENTLLKYADSLRTSPPNFKVCAFLVHVTLSSNCQVRDRLTEDPVELVGWNPVIVNVGVWFPLGGLGRGTPIAATSAFASASVVVRMRWPLRPRRNSLTSAGEMIKLCAATSA